MLEHTGTVSRTVYGPVLRNPATVPIIFLHTVPALVPVPYIILRNFKITISVTQISIDSERKQAD